MNVFLLAIDMFGKRGCCFIFPTLKLLLLEVSPHSMYTKKNQSYGTCFMFNLKDNDQLNVQGDKLNLIVS